MISDKGERKIFFIEPSFINPSVKENNITLLRWHHICFAVDNVTAYEYFTDKKRKPIEASFGLESELSGTIMIGVGGKRQKDKFSSSVALANIKFYPRLLSQEDMEQDANFKMLPGAVLIKMPGNPNENYDFPFNSEDEYNFDIVNFKIKSCNVIDDKDSMVIGFTGKLSKVTCEEAQEFCKVYKAKIPSMDFVEKDDISKLKEANDFFWVFDAKNPKTCQKSLRAQNTYIIEKTNEKKLSFACVVPKNQQYILKASTTFKYDFILSNPSAFIFETLDGTLNMKIDKSTRPPKLAIVSNSNGSLLYSSEVYDPLAVHMGRTDWKNHITLYANDIHFKSILSLCKNNEYTCNSGHCIDIKKICNYDRDCADSSDEKNCDAARKHQGYYDRRLSPASDAKNPTKLSLSFQLDRVIQINMDNSIVKLTLAVVAEWKDSRLAFNNLLLENKTTLVLKEVADTFWHPKITLVTASSSSKTAFHLDRFPGKTYAIATTNGKYSIQDGYERKDIIISTIKL